MAEAKKKKQTGWAILSEARHKAGISRKARIKRGEGKRGDKIKAKAQAAEAAAE